MRTVVTVDYARTDSLFLSPLPGVPRYTGITGYNPVAGITSSNEWQGNRRGLPHWALVSKTRQDDSKFIRSPNVYAAAPAGNPIAIAPMPPGSYPMNVRLRNTHAAGRARVLLWDATDTLLWTGSWQTLTTKFALYTETAVIAGTATYASIEVGL